MGSIVSFFLRPPKLQDLPLVPYTVRFSLDRLSLGADNIHFDVLISPKLRRAANRAAFSLMAREAGIEHRIGSGGPGAWKKRREEFEDRCRDVMTGAVHKAKAKKEIQIDYLAQAALAKLTRRVVEGQFERILETLEQQLRATELSLTQDLSASVSLKEELSRLRQQRRRMIRTVAAELSTRAAEAGGTGLAPLREANFGPGPLLPFDFFSNPMLWADAANEDFFLMENYTLLSRRFEDPDSYERLMTLLSEFLQKTDLAKAARHEEVDGLEADPAADPSLYWMVEENVALLLDASWTEAQLRDSDRSVPDAGHRRRLRQQRRIQRKLLRRLYRVFRRAGLIHRICAGFEVEALAERYCPPLVPQQILRYMVDPASRKRTVAQLNRLKAFYGRSFSVSPIHRAMRHSRNLSKSSRQKRVLEFTRHLVRYHRDATHYRIAKAAMDSIQLDPDDRVLQLSRENQTLYDFLLPDEQSREKQPVIGHVILKADVRGSTDLTYGMRSQGLNPASFFSLNLFDPITEVLFDYDAVKEFLEGDALILSIFEQHETPEGWYSVGRACCLAARILQIVGRSNLKSRKHRLPVLELGIGICYNDSAPAFLFDGNNRIMISPAINRADRLSGCDKDLRKLIEKQKLPFHLYVFQTHSEKESRSTADDLFFRYNVNGIELNAEGFQKLSGEINLVPLRFSAAANGSESTHRFHAGKVPLVHGRYQTLVVREAPVFRVEPETLKIQGKTAHRYYEVCTHPRLQEKAEALLRHA